MRAACLRRGLLDRESRDWKTLTKINAKLAPALGMKWALHILSSSGLTPMGSHYFLEIVAARWRSVYFRTSGKRPRV